MQGSELLKRGSDAAATKNCRDNGFFVLSFFLQSTFGTLLKSCAKLNPFSDIYIYIYKYKYKYI